LTRERQLFLDPRHHFVWAGLNGFVTVAPPTAGSPIVIDVLP
jgi:hypothetical protein